MESYVFESIQRRGSLHHTIKVMLFSSIFATKIRQRRSQMNTGTSLATQCLPRIFFSPRETNQNPDAHPKFLSAIYSERPKHCLIVLTQTSNNLQSDKSIAYIVYVLYLDWILSGWSCGYSCRCCDRVPCTNDARVTSYSGHITRGRFKFFGGVSSHS